MRKKQMKTINIFLFIGFLFFIIGIIFFAVGSAILISGNSFMKNAEKPLLKYLKLIPIIQAAAV